MRSETDLSCQYDIPARLLPTAVDRKHEGRRVGLDQPRWPARSDTSTSGARLSEEIHFAANVARRVMTTLRTKYETIFPKRRQPWRLAGDEDVPR